MYNKIIIAGNLGNDPEMRYQANGSPITNFSVATNRTWTDKNTGEQKKETTWFRVSVWGKQAETMKQYLRRGKQVIVEGRLKPDPQTGSPRVFVRNDGTAGASFEITADVVRFIGSNTAAPTNNAVTNNQDDNVDDIPF